MQFFYVNAKRWPSHILLFCIDSLISFSLNSSAKLFPPLANHQHEPLSCQWFAMESLSVVNSTWSFTANGLKMAPISTSPTLRREHLVKSRRPVKLWSEINRQSSQVPDSGAQGESTSHRLIIFTQTIFNQTCRFQLQEKRKPDSIDNIVKRQLSAINLPY